MINIRIAKIRNENPTTTDVISHSRKNGIRQEASKRILINESVEFQVFDGLNWVKIPEVEIVREVPDYG